MTATVNDHDHPARLAQAAAAAAILALACSSDAAPARGAENGIDVLRADGFAALAGLRVGLVTNHTGIARDGTSTIDLLQRAPSVELAALFGPEHGIRGTEDTPEIGDARDPATGLELLDLPQRVGPTR